MSNQEFINNSSKSLFLLEDKKRAELFNKIKDSRTIAAIGLILQLIMVFQGFHLLSGGFSPEDFLSDYGRIFARRRGVVFIPLIFVFPYLLILVFGVLSLISFFSFFNLLNDSHSIRQKLNEFSNSNQEKKKEYQSETKKLLSDERIDRFRKWKLEVLTERKPTNNLLLASQKILGVPLVERENNELTSLIKVALIYGYITLENWEFISKYDLIDNHYILKSSDGNVLARIKSNDPNFHYQLGLLKILDEGKNPNSTVDEGLLYSLAYAWSISRGKEVPENSSSGCLLPIIGLVLIVLAIALYQNILFIPGIFLLVIGLPPYFKKEKKKSEIVKEWIAAGRPAPGENPVPIKKLEVQGETPLSDKSPSIKKELSLCNKCGAELKINSNFCGKCGSPTTN